MFESKCWEGLWTIQKVVRVFLPLWEYHFLHIVGHTLPPTLYNSISKDVVWSWNLILMMVLQRIRRELLHHFNDASIRSFTDLKIKVKWSTFWHHQTAFASQLVHLLLYVGTHVRMKHLNRVPRTAFFWNSVLEIELRESTGFLPVVKISYIKRARLIYNIQTMKNSVKSVNDVKLEDCIFWI